MEGRDNKLPIHDDLAAHSLLLGVHDRDIQELKEKTHKLSNAFRGLESHVEMIQVSLADIKSFQTNISDKLDSLSNVVEQLEAVKKILTTGKFWIFFGWITFVGLIVIIDHAEHFKHLMGFN